MIIVIGSGPAGVAAAVALLKKGYKVRMVDAGFKLENDREKVVERLFSLSKENWSKKDILTIKENMDPHSEGVNIKYLFGSDFPYKGMDDIQPVQLNQTKMVRSLAKGGLSNVWGASILNYIKDDIDNWPISYDDLDEHYKEVLNFMPFAGNNDELNTVFPLYTKPQLFNSSKQVTDFSNDINENHSIITKEGFKIGKARLAVNFDNDNQQKKCVYCGLCLYGCPYDLIYNSSHTLRDLIKNENFSYLSNLVVNKIVEKNKKIKIYAESLISKKEKELTCDKVFLAAGTVSSTRILLNSLGATNKSVYFKHSDHFQVPLLRYKKTDGFNEEDVFTLTQMFLELDDKSISKNLIHMQLYAYSDLFEKVMINKFGFLYPLVKYPINEFLGRFLVIKGYLHSDISSTIEAKLDNSTQKFLHLKGHPNIEAQQALTKIRKKFVKNRKYFKAYPLPIITKLSLPGIGNHSGGTFPMAINPGKFQTDILGVPHGFNNLHVVDSTVFPTIPSTTISFSIMANAHRIASSI